MPYSSTTLGPSFYHPQQYYSLFRWTIIGTNSAVFILWKYADNTIPFDVRQWLPPNMFRQLGRYVPLDKRQLFQALSRNFLLRPDDVERGRWRTMITSAFSHQAPWHFFFNMYSFDAESRTLWYMCYPNSATHLPLLYVGGALAGSLGWIFESKSGLYQKLQQAVSSVTRKLSGHQQQTSDQHHRYTGDYQRQPSYVLVSRVAQGASVAVSALFAAQTCLAPFELMKIFPIPVPIPSWLGLVHFVGIDWFGMDMMGTESSNTKVGHSAHLAGTAFGLLYAAAFLWTNETPVARLLRTYTHVLERGIISQK